jgi:hypothetical protein
MLSWKIAPSMGDDGHVKTLPRDAVGKIRQRPVFLTALTAVLGLMSMVLAMSIGLINRSMSLGAPGFPRFAGHRNG